MKQLFIVFMAAVCLTATSQDRIKQIDSIFSSQHGKGQFNGNILIAEKGNVVYQKSFGLRDEANGLPLDSNSIFELASVSKQFTAMGIVILQEKGKLKYEDKLSQFFPELNFYGDITVRQLLNHTAGLPDYMDLMSANWDKSKIATNKDVINQIAIQKPAALFAPGTKFEYSNTGYAILASIIEKASGDTYGNFLAKSIFKPLKMENTFVHTRRYAPKEIKNYAYGYIFDENNKKSLPDNVKDYEMVVWLDGIVGDGTVNSTTGDLLKWDRALYTDKLVSKKAIDAVFTPPAGISSDYGFGWIIENNKDYGKMTWHNGGWPGYMTHVERHVDNDKLIVILLNNETRNVPLGSIRKALYGKPLKVSHTEIQLTEKEMLPFVGSYEIAPGYIMEITYANGLKTQLPGQEKFDLFPESKSKFFLKVVDAQLEFVKDENGVVKKAVLHQNGRELEAPRVQ